jgi:hypothetical protein
MQKIDKKTLYEMFYKNKSATEMMDYFKCTKSAIYFSLHSMNLYFKNRRLGSKKITYIKTTYEEAEKLYQFLVDKNEFKDIISKLKTRLNKGE